MPKSRRANAVMFGFDFRVNAAIVLINCMKMMTIDLFTYSMLNLISKGFPIISSIISGFVALLKLPV